LNKGLVIYVTKPEDLITTPEAMGLVQQDKDPDVEVYNRLKN